MKLAALLLVLSLLAFSSEAGKKHKKDSDEDPEDDDDDNDRRGGRKQAYHGSNRKLDNRYFASPEFDWYDVVFYNPIPVVYIQSNKKNMKKYKDNDDEEINFKRGGGKDNKQSKKSKFVITSTTTTTTTRPPTTAYYRGHNRDIFNSFPRRPSFPLPDPRYQTTYYPTTYYTTTTFQPSTGMYNRFPPGFTPMYPPWKMVPTTFIPSLGTLPSANFPWNNAFTQTSPPPFNFFTTTPPPELADRLVAFNLNKSFPVFPSPPSTGPLFTGLPFGIAGGIRPMAGPPPPPPIDGAIDLSSLMSTPVNRMNNFQTIRGMPMGFSPSAVNSMMATPYMSTITNLNSMDFTPQSMSISPSSKTPMMYSQMYHIESSMPSFSSGYTSTAPMSSVYSSGFTSDISMMTRFHGSSNVKSMMSSEAVSQVNSSPMSSSSLALDIAPTSVSVAAMSTIFSSAIPNGK